MRKALAAVVSICVSCSGDDTHRHVVTAQVVPAPIVKGDAGEPAPVAPPPAGAAPLSEDMATSYWRAGTEADAAERFAAHDYAHARDGFTTARAAIADAADPRAIRLELMIGLCDEELGDHADAATHLLVAYHGLPQLSDYIGYHAARSAWLAGDAAAAQPLAAQIAKDSIVGPDAEILLGDLAHKHAKWPELVTYYTDYLARHPSGPFRSEARFDLADALRHTHASPKDVVALYRDIEIEDPLSSWNTKARAELKAMRKSLPKALAQTLDTFTASEDITTGTVLFDNMRNPQSEAVFGLALADPNISAADKCVAAYHLAQSRFKARDRKGAAPMFDDASVACRAAGNIDLAVKSNYNAGRSYSFFGEHQTAIERYALAQTIDPKHSYADDSMLREAEEWTSLGDDAKVEAVLSAIPTRYPDGDNSAEAMWRLGFHAWRAHQYVDAIKWWKKQIALVPHDDNWFGEGEPQYWIGRAEWAISQDIKVGDAEHRKHAIESWEATVREYPAAYYALLALNRLQEHAPQKYQQLVAEISADPAGFSSKTATFTFKPRVEWASPGFARAMELLRLGLGEPAEHELRKLGLTPPADRKPVTDADKQDKLWAIAFLYDHAGRYATSHWPTRWHILDYRRQWPVGTNRAKWLIAYPKAYWELLTRHAALNNVPIAMQIAIVREESAFDPLDESYANAIGLTQMIPPTAKDFSKGTGIDPTRENLRDPEKNVTIGSRFLGSLFKDWNGFTLLVPPSYNAGPAGVRRMLRARGTWAADEFVEGIVDDQARNYTKRVLGTFFTYTWLYEHKVPEIPNTIPTALLPKK